MATFGKTDIGGTDGGAPANYKVGCTFTEPAGGGTITKITAYIREDDGGGTTNVKAGIYGDYSGDAPVNLKASSAVVVVGEWGWYDFTINYEFAGGNKIWLGYITESAHDFKYDAGASNQIVYKSDTYADGFSDPFGSPSYQDWELSIYATYTPSAAAAPLGNITILAQQMGLV